MSEAPVFTMALRDWMPERHCRCEPATLDRLARAQPEANAFFWISTSPEAPEISASPLHAREPDDLRRRSSMIRLRGRWMLGFPQDERRACRRRNFPDV
jgi:hypothetical protein